MGGFDFGGGDDAAGTGETADPPAEPAPLDSRGGLGDRNGPDPHDEPRDGAADGGPVDALLYAGEEARASLPTANGRLVATSHRVLAYAPDADGRATLRTAHRANVTDVSLASTGADRLLRPTLYALLAGVGTVAAGSAVSFSSMTVAAPDAAGATGVGGLLSAISGVLSVLPLLDDLLRVAGACSLLVGAALLGVYAYTRRREVVVATEGGVDGIRADAGGADADAVERFAVDAGLAEAGSTEGERGFPGR